MYIGFLIRHLCQAALARIQLRVLFSAHSLFGRPSIEDEAYAGFSLTGVCLQSFILECNPYRRPMIRAYQVNERCRKVLELLRSRARLSGIPIQGRFQENRRVWQRRSKKNYLPASNSLIGQDLGPTGS